MRMNLRIFSLLALLALGGAGIQAQDDPFPAANINRFSGNMTIVAQVEKNGEVVTDAIVAAYSGTDLRGKERVGAGTNPNIAYLSVGGNNTQEQLYFKVYTSGVIFTYIPDSPLIFRNHSDVGSTANPYIIDITPVSLVNNADNSSVLTIWKDKTCDVELTGRSLTKFGQWNTLCLPFALNAEEIAASDLAGATIKEMSTSGTSFDAESGLLTLTFSPANSIEAGKPYIVRWEDSSGSVSNPVFSGVTIDADASTEVTSTDGKVKFIGTYSPIVYPQGEAYPSVLLMGSNSTLFYPNGSAASTINACRAHFLLTDPSATLKSYVMEFEEEDPDGIRSLTPDRPTPDPSLYGGEIYNLAGQRITPHRGGDGRGLQKGIYIVNGKKILR